MSKGKKKRASLQPYFLEGVVEAGCDEAGRGCLAGPVVAAAVILPSFFELPGLNDSKQLSIKSRDTLRKVIEQLAIGYSVAFVSHEEIDAMNILRASMFAMHKALDGLKKKPQHVIVDGNRFIPYKKIPHTCIVKGDAKYASIAAASIMAKTYRDCYMEELHLQFPHYRWDENKGYPTLAHREAIAKYGICRYHRKTFNLLDNQLKLGL